MRGRHHIRIQNRTIIYEFDVKRNITIIRGDSATGKTTLLDMISQYEAYQETSGIELVCDKNCVVITGQRWLENLQLIRDSIVFIDENDRFITSKEFAEVVKGSDNYFVIITRDNLANLPYSVDEIYGIHTSGKYVGTEKTYNEFYRIYAPFPTDNALTFDQIVCEDSNSGCEFFSSIAEECAMPCESAEGKSKISNWLLQNTSKNPLIIADGAAFGSEMNRLMEIIYIRSNVALYLPESFEWLILKSGLIDGNRIRKIVQTPEDYIDSENYLSWERYFTELLVKETQGSFLRYSKSRLNDVYLHAKEKKAILEAMDVIGRNLEERMLQQSDSGSEE